MIEFLAYLAGLAAAFGIGWRLGYKNGQWKGFDYWRKLDAIIHANSTKSPLFISFWLAWVVWWYLTNQGGGNPTFIVDP